MTYLTYSLLFFFSCLSLLVCVSVAGSRPVHGPAYSNPSDLSPEAYDFFHPKSSFSPINPPKNSHSSPAHSPSASKTSNNVEADSQGSKVSSDEHTTSESRREEGRGEAIGVVLGVSFATFLSLGIFFVIKKRRANMIRTIVIQSDA